MFKVQLVPSETVKKYILVSLYIYIKVDVYV